MDENKHPHIGHETTDVNVWAVGKFAIGLVVVCVVSIALLFGLLIGSFLNVCIYRWPRDLSVVRPRSYCPACEAPIAWYDNVPLVSYAILGGRCRHCGARISLRYPLVEALTGGLFFLLVYRYGLTLFTGKMCVFTAMMVALLFTDLEARILPDEFTVWGTVVGLLFALRAPAPPLF